MDYSIYIIKQNTPESKILQYAGINRNELEIVTWKGRKKRHGGFGKAPVEWRIRGIVKVELLCNTLVKILGARKSLSPSEKNALNRAKKTLKGISNSRKKELKQLVIIKKKKVSIISFLNLDYPTIPIDKIKEIADKQSNKMYESHEMLLMEAKSMLREYIPPIEEAKKIFYETMKIE